MLKKRMFIFVWLIVLLSFVLAETGVSQSKSEYALIQRPVWKNPPIWKLTKSLTESQWGTQLFINSRSEAQGYIMSPDYELFSAASFHLDNAWNRIVFQECLANWIEAVCERGSDTAELLWPSKLDVISPCNSQGPDPFYYIYVADASNDRIVRLRYYWPLGWQYIAWDDPITGGGLSLPQDLDINDGSTHYPHDDDYLWVLNGHEIKRFTTDGVLKCTYGTYGCDQAEGHFCRPTALACGREPSAYQPYSNNTDIYVADQGNHRLVWLRKHVYFDMVYWIESLALPADARIADLETDIFGHLWAVDRDNGRIYKYTHDLYPLCYYGSFGTGEGQFYYPLNFSNTGGYLGCQNAYVTESWTDYSGGQYFVIGTDVLDFEVTSSVDYRWHYINYVLVDPSDVTIEIYDEQDQLVDTLFDAMELSGACTHVWDGTDQFGQPVYTGAYRMVLTDSSSTFNLESGGRVNGVVKEAWVHHTRAWGSPPWDLVGVQTGSDIALLEWQYYRRGPTPWEAFTVYCDGCLCGATPRAEWTYADSGLVPGRSYVYWVRAFDPTESWESDPSNADTVFVGPKLAFPTVSSILPKEESVWRPPPSSRQVDSADIRIGYETVYPGRSTEMELQLKNFVVPICGFNFLIKLAHGDLIDFHTEGISIDSILIGSVWLQYPVRECWIDTSGTLTSRFSSISCRGQVGDTSLADCKYLWVKGWAPPGECIEPYPNYRTLFKFGIDAHCISDSSLHRNESFYLNFGRLYGPEFQEVALKYHQNDVTLWFSVPGDANNDSLVNLGDVTFLVNFLYNRGPAPCIPESGDPNGDCMANVGDITYLISYFYRGGPAPLPGCWHGKRE